MIPHIVVFATPQNHVHNPHPPRHNPGAALCQASHATAQALAEPACLVERRAGAMDFLDFPYGPLFVDSPCKGRV